LFGRTDLLKKTRLSFRPKVTVVWQSYRVWQSITVNGYTIIYHVRTSGVGYTHTIETGDSRLDDIIMKNHVDLDSRTRRRPRENRVSSTPITGGLTSWYYYTFRDECIKIIIYRIFHGTIRHIHITIRIV